MDEININFNLPELATLAFQFEANLKQSLGGITIFLTCFWDTMTMMMMIVMMMVNGIAERERKLAIRENVFCFVYGFSITFELLCICSMWQEREVNWRVDISSYALAKDW